MNDASPAFKTILFSGHDFRFLRPFIAQCEHDPRYRILLDEHRGHEISDVARARELLPGADVIFCEWCLGNAVWYSRNRSNAQTLVVRLHSQELRLPYLDRVEWDKVNALVTICPRNQELVCERYPFLREKTHLVYNPINCNALSQPKLAGAEFNLGMMGFCPMLKAPHRAVELFARLKQIDSRYTLFVKGRHPRDYNWLWRRPEERAYYEKFFAELESSPFANSIVFEPYGDDVPLWFSKIGFILSTSDLEGSHQSVAEGMASGAIPVIRNWPGADALYPSKYVFASIDEAAQAILNWRTPAHYLAEVESCRRHALERFDQAQVCSRLAALIDGLRRTVRAGVATEGLQRARRGKVSPPVLVLGYLPPGFRGGYRIRIEQEIKALVNHGTKVHLACLLPEEADSAGLQSHRTELTALGCEVSFVPIQGFFDIRLDAAKIRATLDALKQITDAGGLRIIHAEALYCARIAWLLKERSPEVCLVFDCHGTTPEEERLSGAHPSRIVAMEDWERRVLAGADLNLFVSEAMNDFYRRQYGPDDVPHLIVPCCVADERFAGESAPSVLGGPPTNRPVLAYTGTMAAWQCGEEMVRLFAQLHRHDQRLFFLLLVPERDHQTTLDLLQSHGLPTDSVLLTEVPHEKVAATLQCAHAGLLLRRAHPVNQVASPTKFGEYLAAGLPVIMTDGIGDFSNIAAENKVGLVLEASLLGLAEFPAREVSRISRFIHESVQHRPRVSARCRDVARKHLHWDVAATVLSRGYCGLLHGGDTP